MRYFYVRFPGYPFKSYVVATKFCHMTDVRMCSEYTIVVRYWIWFWHFALNLANILGTIPGKITKYLALMSYIVVCKIVRQQAPSPDVNYTHYMLLYLFITLPLQRNNTVLLHCSAFSLYNWCSTRCRVKRTQYSISKLLILDARMRVIGSQFWCQMLVCVIRRAMHCCI